MGAVNVLRQLREILAQIYSEVADTKRIGYDAGVQMERVVLTGSALTIWDGLLREAAHSQRLAALLALACGDYADNQALLAAVAAYKESAKLDEGTSADGKLAVLEVPPPALDAATLPVPELAQHGLAWLQPYLTIEEVGRLTRCLTEFVPEKPNAQQMRLAAESVADLEKRFIAHSPVQLVDATLRGRVLLCSVGFRPLPVILSTLIIQPKKLYLLHSEDSRRYAEAVRDDPAIQAIAHLASKDIQLEEMSLTDAPKNYALLQQVVNENPGQAFVVDISGGVKVMGTSLAAAAYWQRIPVIYQLGEEVGFTIKPFSERLVAVENPFVYFGSAELRSIRELCGQGEYDAALAVCRNLTDTTGDPGTLGTLQILTKFIHIYRDWDAFGHSQPVDDPTRKLATRLREVRQSMQRLRLHFVQDDQVDHNLHFLTQLEQGWQPGQRNLIDRYRLVDIFVAARRRAATGKYDDAVARLYRVLEMSASFCLLRDCAIGDSKVPDFGYFVGLFGSLEAVQEEFGKQARYALPMTRLGLNDQMTLLGLSGQAAHKTIAGIYRGMERDGLLEMRNRSILAHGTVSVSQADYEQFEQKSAEILARVIGDKEQLEVLRRQATHPAITVVL